MVGAKDDTAAELLTIARRIAKVLEIMLDNYSFYPVLYLLE
jgi:hypothetical protein